MLTGWGIKLENYRDIFCGDENIKERKLHGLNGKCMEAERRGKLRVKDLKLFNITLLVK